MFTLFSLFFHRFYPFLSIASLTFEHFPFFQLWWTNIFVVFFTQVFFPVVGVFLGSVVFSINAIRKDCERTENTAGMFLYGEFTFFTPGLFALFQRFYPFYSDISLSTDSFPFSFSLVL